MSGNAYANQLPQGPARSAILNLYAEIQRLNTRIAALEAVAVTKATTIDAGGLRVSNLAPPQAGTDAATVDFVRQVAQQQVQTFP